VEKWWKSGGKVVENSPATLKERKIRGGKKAMNKHLKKRRALQINDPKPISELSTSYPPLIHQVIHQRDFAKTLINSIKLALRG